MHSDNRNFICLGVQVSGIFKDIPFKVFADALEDGGIIKAICVPSGAKVYSNTALKKGELYSEAIKSGAKGLPFLKVLEDGTISPSLPLFLLLVFHFCFLGRFYTSYHTS